MISKTNLAIMCAIAPLAFAKPAEAYDRLPSALARLSPVDFANKVQIIDDPLEPNIVFTTQAGYGRGRSIEGAHADDVHLQAIVDRRTGRASWQVWHKLIYVGNRRDITSIQYRADGQLNRADVLAVEHGLDQCPSTDGIGSCNQFVRIAFELSEHTIHEIAATYRPGHRTPWRLRFKDAQTRDVTSGLAPAEAAGLVLALEQWRQANS